MLDWDNEKKEKFRMNEQVLKKLTVEKHIKELIEQIINNIISLQISP